MKYNRFLLGLGTKDGEFLAPYGGCEYNVGALAAMMSAKVQEFWGCGIPGKNDAANSMITPTNTVTTDTGCGNFYV